MSLGLLYMPLTGVELVAIISSATTGIAGIVIALSLKKIQCCFGACHCQGKPEDKPQEQTEAPPDTITPVSSREPSVTQI